jgi:hypothetical protein
MIFTCPQGCRVEIGISEVHTRSNEKCEDHGLRLSYGKSLKRGTPREQRGRGSGLRRGRKQPTPMENAAARQFVETVGQWPCWFKRRRPCEQCLGEGEVASVTTGQIFACGLCDGTGQHVCSGRKDCHHLIPKNFIRRRLSDWPEPELLAVLFNPLIGAPLCRKAHDAITAKTDRIYWEDLTPECIEYVGSLPDFLLLRLEEECAKRAKRAASPQQSEREVVG